MLNEDGMHINIVIVLYICKDNKNDYLRRCSTTITMTITLKKTRPPTPPPIAAAGNTGSPMPVCWSRLPFDDAVEVDWGVPLAVFS